MCKGKGRTSGKYHELEDQIIEEDTMRYLLVPICVMLCLSVFVPAASSKDIRVAAWNIEHFRDQNLEGPNPRTDADYERLAKYVAQMDADIVGLQEVEGTSAAQRIFPSRPL
jgi:hypothetical protein